MGTLGGNSRAVGQEIVRAFHMHEEHEVQRFLSGNARSPSRNTRQLGALDSRSLELHSERDYGAPSRDRRNAAGFPFCVGAWLTSGGQNEFMEDLQLRG